jgi:hypothetical protein
LFLKSWSISLFLFIMFMIWVRPTPISSATARQLFPPSSNWQKNKY